MDRKIWWGTVLTAMVTPMDEQGRVDLATAAKLGRFLVSKGCSGIVVSGTTGEAATLTRKEKIDLFRTVKEHVGASGLVIAGVGSNCTRDTVELIEAAEATPVDGYMVVTPYYNKPTPEGIVAHYKAVDASSSRPIMAYNVPGRTAFNLSLDMYADILAACPRVTAVKEADTDLEKAAAMVSTIGSRAALFSGNDSCLFPLLALGFQGVVSVAANIIPGQMAAIVNAVAKSNWEEARNMHLRYLPLFKALFSETNPVPVKQALAIQGWPVGRPRLPLTPLAEANCRHLEQLALLFKSQ